MSQRIDDSVVVLTGASSGIARAAALAFARRGASVVLAARSTESLEQVADDCERAGGRALAVCTDVGDESAVQALAARAQQAFGRIDVWVNAAAVIVYGEFERIPSDTYRQVLETNLLGQIHGARAALPYFRAQRGGTLVNVGSVWGSISSPYVSAYSVSKFGVRALSEALQQELRSHPDTRAIRVCTIEPPSVDTPIFRHAARYTDRAPQPVPLTIDPSRAVRAILLSVQRPRLRRIVGGWARFLESGHAVAPGLFNRLAPLVMRTFAFRRSPGRPGSGNVFEPMPEWNRIEGNWRRGRDRA